MLGCDTTLLPGTTTMTDDKIAPRALLEEGSDATFLREMISLAVEELTQLATETLCSAASGERSTDRINQRNGYRDRDWETRAGTVEFRIPKIRPTGIGNLRSDKLNMADVLDMLRLVVSFGRTSPVARSGTFSCGLGDNSWLPRDDSIAGSGRRSCCARTRSDGHVAGT